MTRLGLFDAYGVEVEYMIVNAQTLKVMPIADRILVTETGELSAEIEHGPVAWSNELALHVVELKTNGPSTTLTGIADQFQQNVIEINRRLAPFGACLLPGAMHPTMDPNREITLWPHEYGPVYQTFDRIFNCQGHGWANLQSTHINYPFASDEEFARLHAAIRLVLPIIPALAASSPIADGLRQSQLDYRMEVYRHNARRVPSVAARIIPEVVRTESEYQRVILSRIYHDLAPLDPDGILRHEWVNARGAIARFERGAIEIRVMDVQEAPCADLAIVRAISAVIQALAADIDPNDQHDTDHLAAIFEETLVTAETTVIRDVQYLDRIGHPNDATSAGDLWSSLIDTHVRKTATSGGWLSDLDVILREGPLARRLITALKDDTGPEAIRETYGRLAKCLSDGSMFHGNS